MNSLSVGEEAIEYEALVRLFTVLKGEKQKKVKKFVLLSSQNKKGVRVHNREGNGRHNRAYVLSKLAALRDKDYRRMFRMSRKKLGSI